MSKQLEQALDVLYGAIGDDCRWEDALRSIGQIGGGADVCRLTGWDTAAQCSPMFVRASDGLDTNTLHRHEAAYFATYRHLDPRISVSRRYLQSKFDSTEPYLNGIVQRSEFFQDFMRPNGDVRWTIGGRVYELGHVYVDFALERVAARGDFTKEDDEALNAVRPHLQRAVRAHLRFTSAGLHRAGQAAVLDSLPSAVAVVDSSRCIKFLNAAAEFLFRKNRTLCVKEGKLNATVNDQCRALAGVIQRVASTGESVSVLIGGLRDTEDIALHAYPTERQFGTLVPGLGKRLVTCLLVPSSMTAPSSERLQQLYSLTTAQARIAAWLASGCSPDDAAIAAGVAIGTVRTHIRKILEKTSSSGLPELRARLAGVPCSMDAPARK